MSDSGELARSLFGLPYTNLPSVVVANPIGLTNSTTNRGERGNPTALATRALANKWVKVIFALWQKRETYNESFHLWDKARYTLKARAA